MWRTDTSFQFQNNPAKSFSPRLVLSGVREDPFRVNILTERNLHAVNETIQLAFVFWFWGFCFLLRTTESCFWTKQCPVFFKKQDDSDVPKNLQRIKSTGCTFSNSCPSFWDWHLQTVATTHEAPTTADSRKYEWIYAANTLRVPLCNVHLANVF